MNTSIFRTPTHEKKKSQLATSRPSEKVKTEGHSPSGRSGDRKWGDRGRSPLPRRGLCLAGGRGGCSHMGRPTTPKENIRRSCIYFKACLIPSNEIISGTRMFMPDNRSPGDPARASLVNTHCQTRGGGKHLAVAKSGRAACRSPEVAAASPPALDPADICRGFFPASVSANCVRL